MRFGMMGSEVALDFSAEQNNNFDSVASMMATMQHYFAGKQYDDVAELCGGAAGTTALLVRRGYRGGPNFDLICGCDLMTDDGWWELD